MYKEHIMYFDDAEGMVFRPPSEANSLILRLTIGCSHNACSFCAMYKNVQFRKRTVAEIDAALAHARIFHKDVQRVFLADGNALGLETTSLLAVLEKLHAAFPRLARVGIYASPKDVLRKNPEELATLHQAGLKIAYMGIESGDPQILQAINKGVTREQIIDAGQKVLAAGIKLSSTVILGLGGQELTLQHAANTASIITAIEPTMLGALTLMVYPGTPLAERISQGTFTPLTTTEILVEQHHLLQDIHVAKPCIYRSNHASNFLPISGTLPKDRSRMLTAIQDMLSGGNVPKQWNFKE
jgi:radical SAM superfamily enzyme YgiQ (UPF0313 family)